MGYDNSAKSKMIRHRNHEYYKDRRQQAIANSIREKESYIYYQPNGRELFKQGEALFNSGLSLEDASEELRTNHNFVQGYEHAMRIQNVEDDFFVRGSKAYLDGLSWENIPENDKNNESFMRGYEEAMTMHIGRHK